jgi:hypothetical protein
MPSPDDPTPDLMPPLGLWKLPSAVDQARRDAALRDAANAERLRASIDAHLDTCDAVLDEMASDHQAIADQVDFALDGDTRYAVVWQIAGRSIGFSRGFVALLRAGFTAEAWALGRTLHECNRLVDAFEDPDDGDALVARWLADTEKGHVRPRDARDAERRADQRHHDAMVKAGYPPVGPTAPLTSVLYRELSQTAHHRRRAVQSFVDGDLHTMIRGPHPDWRVRAAYVRTGSDLVEESVLAVGHALGRFTGSTAYLVERLMPLQERLHAVRASATLPTKF